MAAYYLRKVKTDSLINVLPYHPPHYNNTEMTVILHKFIIISEII